MISSLSSSLPSQTLVKCYSQMDAFYDYTVHPSVISRGKRLIDIMGALVGLAIMGIILIPVAIAIWLDSPGPIFYSQIRYGYLGRPFRMWKFRSMINRADQLKHTVENQVTGHFFKNQNDFRITRVGRILRQTSLDEFPQFWNVLIGDMSLVGTRPPILDEVVNYDGYHWQRLLVKPGITGEWQIKGRSQIKNFDEVVGMDLDYQKKWSLLYDTWVILQTIGVVWNRCGAY